MKKNPEIKKEQPSQSPVENVESTVQSSEKDLDELVHLNDTPDVETLAEQDPDEAIHQVSHDTPDPLNEVDVDDLLHRGNDEQDGV